MTAALAGARRLGARLPDGLADAVWLWLALRIGLGLIAALVVLRGAAVPACDSDIGGRLPIPPLANDGVWFPLAGVWQHWDACWYSRVAWFGYEGSAQTTNFFPLLPFLMRAVSALTGDNLALAGLLVNALAFIAALTGLYQLVRDDVDAGVARRTVLYLAVFPSAFFFLAPFTESLFLAGAVWAIAGARRGRWDIVLVAGLVAGLSRPQGLLLALPLGWEALRSLRARLGDRGSGPAPLRPSDAVPLVVAITPALACAGFVGYTVAVGTSYFEAHSGWAATRLVPPWQPVVDAFGFAVERQDTAIMAGAVLLIAFTVLTLAGLRRLPLSYTLYSAPQLLLMTTQQTVWPLMSTIRYLAVLFPVFVVLALIGRRERFNTVWLVASTLLLGYFASLFVAGVMIG